MTQAETARLGASAVAAPGVQPPLAHERANFAAMVAHAVLDRTGWIWKLESVVIPAFVGTLTGSRWVMAGLPALRLVGRRLPSLASGRIAYGRERLRGALMAWTGSFAALWGVLAAVLWLARPGPDGLFLAAFLVLYTVSSGLDGAREMTHGALVGRVVSVTRRGRYVGFSLLLGGVTAIASGLVIDGLLRNGRPLEARDFAPLFVCVFGFFALAALVLRMVREAGGRALRSSVDGRHFWRRVRQVLPHDRNFRRLVTVVLLMQVQSFVFPFYLRLGLEAGAVRAGMYGTLILVQNVSLAVVSLLLGRRADRGGHRRVLLLCFLVQAVTPALAVGCAQLPGGLASAGFILVFVLLGFGPVLQRLLSNYVLEISTPADQPVYLSVLETSQLASLAYMPVVGAVARYVGIAYAMAGASAVMALAAVLALALVEPRHAPGAPTGWMPETDTDGAV